MKFTLIQSESDSWSKLDGTAVLTRTYVYVVSPAEVNSSEMESFLRNNATSDEDGYLSIKFEGLDMEVESMEPVTDTDENTFTYFLEEVMDSLNDVGVSFPDQPAYKLD